MGFDGSLPVAGMDAKRSGRSLLSALRREEAQWETWMERGLRKGVGLVTPAERDRAILWMTTVANGLGLAPDISPAAAMIVDYALSASGVQNKYVCCMALSSLYTATKMLEEPEAVPPVSAYVKQSKCLFSVQELIRMERVVLQLLDWHLDFVTPYTFVELVLSMKFDQGACVPIAKRLSPLLNALCASHLLLTTYRPSALAYAALSLALQSSTSPKRWFQLDATLSRILNVPPEKAASCKQRVLCALANGHALLTNDVLVPFSLVVDEAIVPRLGRKRRRQRSRLLSQCFEKSSNGGTVQDGCDTQEDDVLGSIDHLYRTAAMTSA
uniref:CYCLIN domain-containing protein n=1 Tax=Trichuris muris TaxID=70415 RepID=A0A5S6QR68_TRIMR